ncbi:FtsK/SpoIIIE domain-containing protein [Cryobacterium sp. PH31-O1]|uniref:FtsK/SpoIIIE domain-containing protein n=1 Tax=Cryobacterium sp. PH31-O1 TaxID=3046306 RepID=UPI0024B89659|nr:FtsK/SpoIIIE domain-containing protein [Cryobacterium sp. PH31-O1]MDJ0339729.1 FtsK/SpoIIIE domain-containing protein [Cryobacterium sp. PH31-O1]
MLNSIQTAGATLGLATPRKPWLVPLERVLDLAQLPVAGGPAIALEMQGEPGQQRQSPFLFDPDSQGNLAVLGTSGSGKSTALRTLLLSASRDAEQNPLHIYGIDCAGGALGMLGALPTVGGIIAGEDGERVARLMRHLVATATDRAVRYSALPASTLSDYRQVSGNVSEPRIIVVIDGMANFRSSYEFRSGDTTFAALAQLMSVGRQVGIHFILSADRSGVIPSALNANIQQNVVLRLASSNDYGILGVPADILEDAPAGRAVIDGNEVQIAVLGGSASLGEQSVAAQQLADRLRQTGIAAAPAIERLAERIPLSQLGADGGRAVIGVADADLLPVGIAPEGLVVVTGPFRSGKTTTIKTFVRTTLRDGSQTGPAGGEPSMIVVESAGDFEGSSAEAVVASLIKAARKD